MSDRMRWRYGDTNPVVAAVDSATVIEIGDLVYQDIDVACPASNSESIRMFIKSFLGVAMQRSIAGDTAPVRVATTGVFEFDCPSGRFELGDLMGPAEDESGNVFLSQAVKQVETADRAIGRVARRVVPAASTVLVDIRSTVMTGGVFAQG